MASAEELLAAMSEPDEDERVILTIDENLRIVTIPSVALVIGVKGDKDVNRIWFKMDRNYRGTDLSEFIPKVYYTNAAGEKYYYQVWDSRIEGKNLLFSWLVGRDAAVETGTVEFGVCMQRLIAGSVVQEFNTTTATMQCLKGACNQDAGNDSAGQDVIAILDNMVLGQRILG